VSSADQIPTGYQSEDRQSAWGCDSAELLSIADEVIALNALLDAEADRLASMSMYFPIIVITGIYDLSRVNGIVTE
jgi:hypothetical protein